MTSPHIKLSKFRDIAACLVLCTMIFVPFFLGLVQKDKDVSSSEKRTLAALPAKPTNLAEVQSYPRLFETYYADHFGFRDWLIKRYKTVKYNLGDSPSADLTLGKDGWLFLGNIKETYTKFHDPFGDVRNINLYTEGELKKFAENVSNFEAWLEVRDIPYVMVIPPNKHTTYFDKLPSSIQREAPTSALDQLIGYLRDNTDITIVDLRDSLSAERKTHDVFRKTDTHWNHYGANVAQYEILNVVKDLISDRKTPKLYEMRLDEPRLGDLAGMLGVDLEGDANPQPILTGECQPTRKTAETNLPKTTVWTCDTRELKALIYHDSFFGALKPYFNRHFSRTTYIPTAANPKSVKEQIEFNKPDIFIEEWVERKLPRPYSSKYVVELKVHAASQRFKSGVQLSDAQSLYARLNTKLKLRNMERVGPANETSINLVSTGTDPIIYFPDLELRPGIDYKLRIVFMSEAKSNARLYYSTSDKIKFPFSDANSVKLPVKAGENDLYFEFSSATIGNRLRLDLLSGEGSVKITQVEIYNE